MPAPRVELLLARHADTAWGEVVRPWLEGGHGRLVRSYVVVATRGQAQGLKQRCVAENLVLLGVEFLTPGLARQKWLPLVSTKPALGRELLLFELRVAIAQRLQSLEPDDPRQGILKSLQSDAERALDDFDELLKAGFSATDFAHESLREIFTELAARVDELGYGLGASQSATVALAPVPPDGTKIGGRLLVYGLSAEAWGEFFNVAAFARRFDEITVVLPEPEFRGNRALDEKWVELWQTFLGANALPIDAAPTSPSCEYVAGWWRGAGEEGLVVANDVLPPRILVGRTRDDEMKLVADEVVRLLDDGASDIAVVFPKADAAHAGLLRHLTERKITFVNLLPGVGATSLEVQLQRALLGFYEQGGKLEGVLALWPLLRASGLTEISAGAARDVCERLFDERQTHAVAAYTELLAGRSRPEWKEFNRIVSLLLPVWPDELTLADAVTRFRAACERLELIFPENWAALSVFSERETRVLPSQEIFAALASFLPEKTPAAGEVARSGFARVTLTTRRRAEGLVWSHIIFAESNAGIWPTRQRVSGWLSDEHRAVLNARSRFSLGVFSADDRAWLEKRSYAALARDTKEQLIFSAALTDDAEPETRLTPNGWLERVLWRAYANGGDIQSVFESQAQSSLIETEPSDWTKSWLTIWNSRRDPKHAFDEYFCSVDPTRIRPERLPARLIESAVADPAELWFGAVLGVSRVKQGPLVRSRQRSLGQLAHRVVAVALRGDSAEGRFFDKPEPDVALRRLTEELGRLRGLWPADRFWDSFHAGLTQVCEALLENLFQLPSGRVMATELRLPVGATVPFGLGAGRLSVSGRMDVVIADRTDWTGASIDIVDFKTGGDPKLSAERMANNGSGLQLGVYLAAVQSLGAQAGRVWMLKAEHDGAAAMEMGELAQALLPLERIAQHLASGRYGALTPDKSAHSSAGLVWPLACAPIPVAVLREKFLVTFGETAVDKEDNSDE
jgi:hypothetical protein